MRPNKGDDYVAPLEDETVYDMVWSTSSLGPVLDASVSKDGEYFYPASATKGPFGVAFSVKDEKFEDIWIENGEENMMMTPEQFEQLAQSTSPRQGGHFSTPSDQAKEEKETRIKNGGRYTGGTRGGEQRMCYTGPAVSGGSGLPAGRAGSTKVPPLGGAVWTLRRIREGRACPRIWKGTDEPGPDRP